MSIEINYQPTGVYKQFVDNPALLNSEVSHSDNKKNKFKRTAKLGAACAGIAALGGGIYCYKKNSSAINLKKETFGNALNFENFIKNKEYSNEDITRLQKIWSEGEKFQNGATGKIQNALERFSNFFHRNFYNY